MPCNRSLSNWLKGMGIAALSTAALVMLHRGSPERSALLSKTVSSLDTNVGNRRFERT